MKHDPVLSLSVPCLQADCQLELRQDLKKDKDMFITRAISVRVWAADSPKAGSLFLLPALSLALFPHKHVLACVLMCRVCVHMRAHTH